MYDVVDGVHLEKGREFIAMKPGIADGMRIDEHGHLWTSAAWGGDNFNSVRCYTPDGVLLGRINIPEPVSNLCFGGLHKNRLFITAGRSLYSIFLNTQGV